MAGNVLYIEDEKFLGKTLQGMLEKAGFTVSLATDGESGLREAQSGTFNIILLDILLPKMDGFEILKRLNQSGISLKTPVIVLSNLNSPQDEEKAKMLGARGYFVKAMVDPRDLVVGIEKVLAKQHS